MTTTSFLKYSLIILNSSTNSHSSVESSTDTYSPDHAGTTNSTCSACGKRFSRTPNLKRHILFDCKHSLKKHFACRNPGCRHGSQRPFTRESYRNIHEQRYCKAVVRTSSSVKSSIQILSIPFSYLIICYYISIFI